MADKKIHTTNYQNTFILIADDCPVGKGEVPPLKEIRTAANIQFELIRKNPYRFTSDDVLFHVYAEKNDLAKSEMKKARDDFFSKGQPCMRASPLTKRYGWGIHSDKDGRVAIYASDSAEYKKFSIDKSLQILKAMRSGK